MSCQVMYQSYYQSYFNSYHPNTSPPAAVSSATAAANLSSGIAGNSGPSPPATVLDLHREAATASPHSPASSSTKSSLPSVHLHRSSMSMLVSSTDYQVSSFLPGDLERLSSITEHPKKKLLAYGGEMQHSSENVYESQPQQHSSSAAAANEGLQMSPATNPTLPATTQANPQQQQQQSNYLSSSPHVQQPLPASTMASSVAALQRLSASIDVTVSRSNSRASAYEDNSNKEQSEKLEGQQHQQPLVPTIVAQSGLSGEQHPVEDQVEHHGPTYLKANCVLYTFYGGDLKTAIDDHFNRALKESSPSGQQHPQDPGSDSPSHSESSAKLQQQHRDSPVPMSQRNLPASFWNCDYYQHPHHHSSQHLQHQQPSAHQHQQYDPYDAYVSAAADPWHNPWYQSHHRASDMYQRQYSSLLQLQSSAIARQAHQQGRQVAAALGKAPNESWAAAAAGAAAVDGFASASGHYTGLEAGTMQAPSKDQGLYGFW